ncbi:MAG: DUF5615 family PIN-like protein [Hyphomicrobiaceae bacterium]
MERSADSYCAPEAQVLALTFSQGRVLHTEDNDFGDLTIRRGLPTQGVVRGRRATRQIMRQGWSRHWRHLVPTSRARW